ncbi:MAG: DUF302 domain-containing protein [Alphaproteobacteria bacterium]|nr:DUF302 domain-containing protein [Alphaproteobacteria bacterium]
MRALILALAVVLVTIAPVSGNTAGPRAGDVTVETNKPFATYVDALREAIRENGFNIVGIACANCAIKGAFQETVPGNRVFLFFRPDYARRMLKASLAAGIEAPIRLYVTEASDSSAVVTYRLPSHIFGAYGVAELTAMGKELDDHVAAILDTAASKP